jgi:biotin operon repressor
MSDKQINKSEMRLSVTQAQLILNYIAERGSITSLEAITQLGITQLSSRISELRRKGYNIEKVPERVKNRYGKSCTVLRYYLVNNEGTTNLKKYLLNPNKYKNRGLFYKVPK